MFCDEESKAANAAFPLNVTFKQQQRLLQENLVDMDLYNNLVHCPNGIQFPDPTESYVAKMIDINNNVTS